MHRPCRRAHIGIVVQVLPVQLLVVVFANAQEAFTGAQVARVDGLACIGVQKGSRALPLEPRNRNEPAGPGFPYTTSQAGQL